MAPAGIKMSEFVGMVRCRKDVIRQIMLNKVDVVRLLDSCARRLLSNRLWRGPQHYLDATRQNQRRRITADGWKCNLPCLLARVLNFGH